MASPRRRQAEGWTAPLLSGKGTVDGRGAPVSAAGSCSGRTSQKSLAQISEIHVKRCPVSGWGNNAGLSPTGPAHSPITPLGSP